MLPDYVNTADTLTQRILKLIPGNPEILTMKNPFDLYKIHDFDCMDLDASLAQAIRAIESACAIYRSSQSTKGPACPKIP